MLDLKGPFEKYKLVSSIYPFNSKLIYIAASNAGFLGSANATIKGWGWNAFPGVWKAPLDTSSPGTMPLTLLKYVLIKVLLRIVPKPASK